MIALYRKGNTHVIRGVKCEMGRFETKRLQGCLNSGWVTNPQDLLEVEEPNMREFKDLDIKDPYVDKPKKKAGRPRKKR